MSFTSASPLGLPYCHHCLNQGCVSCEQARAEIMRKITLVDGFLHSHLKGGKLSISNNEQLMEILYEAILFGRRQVQKETRPLPGIEAAPDRYDRFANLDYLPKETPDESTLAGTAETEGSPRKAAKSWTKRDRGGDE